MQMLIHRLEDTQIVQVDGNNMSWIPLCFTFMFWVSDSLNAQKPYSNIEPFFVLQGVQIDGKGNIVVDEFQNTSAKSIYALGDVCGKALLTPGKWTLKYMQRSPVMHAVPYFNGNALLLHLFYFCRPVALLLSWNTNIATLG